MLALVLGLALAAAPQQLVLAAGADSSPAVELFQAQLRAAGIEVRWDPLPDIASFAARGNAGECDLNLVAGNQNWQTQATGVAPSYTYVRTWPVATGRFFTQAETDATAKVAVLGQTVISNLFPGGTDPVGQTVLLRGIPFTVIGTLSPKGQSGAGQDQDDTVLIPYTSALERLTGATTERETLRLALMGIERLIVGAVPDSEHAVMTIAVPNTNFAQWFDICPPPEKLLASVMFDAGAAFQRRGHELHQGDRIVRAHRLGRVNDSEKHALRVEHAGAKSARFFFSSRRRHTRC